MEVNVRGGFRFPNEMVVDEVSRKPKVRMFVRVRVHDTGLVTDDPVVPPMRCEFSEGIVPHVPHAPRSIAYVLITRPTLEDVNGLLEALVNECGNCAQSCQATTEDENIRTRAGVWGSPPHTGLKQTQARSQAAAEAALSASVFSLAML